MFRRRLSVNYFVLYAVVDINPKKREPKKIKKQNIWLYRCFFEFDATNCCNDLCPFSVHSMPRVEGKTEAKLVEVQLSPSIECDVGGGPK